MASTPPAAPHRPQAAGAERPVDSGPPATAGRMRDVRLHVGRVTLALLLAMLLAAVVLALL